MTSTCRGMSTLHSSSTSPFPMTIPHSTKAGMASRFSWTVPFCSHFRHSRAAASGS